MTGATNYTSGGIHAEHGTSSGDHYSRYDLIQKPGPDLQGTVEDQDGTAVPNADVVLLAEYKNNTGDRLSEVREQLQSIEPDTFDKDLSLTGSDGHFQDREDTYAAVHTTEDWTLGGYQPDEDVAALGADPDLTQPDVLYTTEDELVVHVRDATETPLVQDNVDEDLPGVTTSGEVVVEKVDAANNTIHKFSPNTSAYVETRWGGQTLGGTRKVHEAVEIGTLPTGFYRVYPASNPGAAYTVAVAPDGKLSNMDQQPWVQDLNTTKGKLEERAQELSDLTNQSGVAIHHTTADSDGKWNYSFSNSVREVDIMAMKKPSTMDASDYDGDYATYGEITTYINDTIDAARESSTEDPSDAICNGAADDTGTVYLADGRVTAEPVESNITVPTRSASATPDVAPLNRLCLEEDVRNLLENSSLSDLAGLLDLEDMSTEELRNWMRDLQSGMLEENEAACKRYLSAAGASDLSPCDNGLSDDDGDDKFWGGGGGGGTPIYTDPGDYNASELRDRIDDLEEALDETSDTVDDGELRACKPGGTDADNPGTCPSTPDAGSNNVTWVYDTGLEDVQPDEVSVRIQFSNGSTRVTTANRSEHIRIEDQTVGSDVVVIEEYPLGDANNALFSVDVLTAEGSAGSSGSVRNPAFDGEIPGLQAVRVSSTAPGPSDRVVVEAIADEQRPFDSIAGMTVEGPDGNELNRSNITDGRASFTTNGSGEHRVELVLERNGNNFTEVVTIGARNTPVKRPPTIRPAEGVTGEFVIVSDGFESGDVEIRDAGAEVVVVGQIGEDDDVPRRLHVHTQALDTAKTHATTIRVVRGENERLLQTRTTSVLHATAISEDGIIYRDEDQPIPRNGGNQFGESEIDPVNGTTVETYSRADGVLLVELRNEPGRVAKAWYATKLQFPVLADPPVVGQVGPVTPELPSPDLPLTPAGPMLLLGAGLLGRRWSA